MSAELHSQLEAVTDEASFLNFVEALRRDRIAGKAADQTGGTDGVGPNHTGWENHTIEDYLGAATAWAKDSGFGETQGIGDEQLWKKFAVFLYCGKIYE